MARYRARSKNWNLPKPLAHTWREIKQVFAWTLPIAIGMALALALISYRSFDPSWNATGAGEVQNWLGKPGALIADFLLQSFGMASALLAVAFIMWGWRRRLEQDIPSKWLRLLYTPALLLLVALFSSTLPTPDAWPFAGGLGGLVGGLLLGKTLSLIPFHSPLVVLGVGILAFAASAGLLLLTLGMSWQESKNLFHGIISYSIWAFSYGVYWLKRAHAITANLLKREAASIAPPLPLEAAAPPPPPEIKKKAIIVEAPVKPKREPVQTKLDLASSDDFQLPPADLLAKPTRKATEYLSP
ncbi:MAG: DNA translocase FtsK 4TM domain-containing protein, partial [Dongiaceae bacterium]